MGSQGQILGGRRLPASGWILFAMAIFGIFAGSSLPAQDAYRKGSLTYAEFNGKKMFQQRCAVCHMPVVVDDSRTWGPALSAETVIGKEPVVREFIRRGTARMPGFQYGLEPQEIDDIITYLKTVKKTEPKKAPE